MIEIPPELKIEDELLIFLSQTSFDPEKEIRVNNLIEKGVNWNNLLKKASYHRLRPLVYSNLKKYSDTVPEDILNILKDYYFRNTQKNLLFMGELFRLLKLFKRKNIMIIPYKGPILAIYGYGNLSMREFGDIDLLIDKNDFQMVKRILIHENYETVLNLSSSKEAEYMKSQRECKFKNTDNGILLEIQWDLTGFSFPFLNSPFPVNNSLKLISINNHEINAFTDEDLILILSFHVAGHMWSRLSWMVDIAELIKKSEVDWDHVMKKAHFLSIERILYLNLSLSQKLFNLQLPKNVQESMKNDVQVKILEKQILKLIFAPEDVSVLNKIKLRFKMRENKLNGFKDLWRILTIPQSDEWSSFEDNLPTILLYIFKRPFQIIKRIKEQIH